MRTYQKNLQAKYYQLSYKLERLFSSGRFYLLKAPKRYNLLKRLDRLRVRLERSGLLTGKLALLSGSALLLNTSVQAQPSNLNIFRGDGEEEPFGLSDIPINSSFMAPVFVDIDRDGDFDMFSGTLDQNNINFYENVGTSTQPEFNSVQINPFGIDLYGYLLTPEFADIDGDGDFDLFAGGGESIILFQENVGNATAPFFTDATSQPFGLGTETMIFGDGTDTMIDFVVGPFAHPTFGDIDEDGDLDVIIGNNYGYLHFIENTGNTTNPSFALDSTSPYSRSEGFGGESIILVSPALCDMDGDGDLDLVIGTAYGNTFLVENYGSGFELYTDDVLSLNGGDLAITQPAPVDIDGDGDLDMFLGNFKGGNPVDINFFPGRIGPGGLGHLIDQSSTAPFGMTRTFGRNSTMVDIDDDGDMDMFFIGGEGKVYFAENYGTRFTPSFGSNDSEAFYINFYEFFYGGTGHLAFADIDSDGDLDVFVQGAYSSTIKMHKNYGTPSVPYFASYGYSADPYSLSLPNNADFNFTDIDDDGDLDLFYLDGATLYFIRNEGPGTISSSTFNDFGGCHSSIFDGTSLALAGAPQFADIDNDGDLELIMGTYYGMNDIVAFEIDNSAPTTLTAALGFGTLVNTSNLYAPEHISLVDIDNDGDLDLFATRTTGSVYFLENINCAFQIYANHFLPHRSKYTSYISSSSIGQVPPGRDIIIEGGEVNLLPGFEVKKDDIAPTENPTFMAQIGGCFDDISLGGGAVAIAKPSDDRKEQKANKQRLTQENAVKRSKVNLSDRNLDQYPLIKKILGRED